MHEQQFTEGNGDREGVPNVVILLSDGNHEITFFLSLIVTTSFARLSTSVCLFLFVFSFLFLLLFDFFK